VQTSEAVTIGTPNANGTDPHGAGFVRLGVRTNPSDVSIRASVTDVRCLSTVTTCGRRNLSGGPDYAGELRATTVLRITDELNSVSGHGTGQGTVEDISFPIDIACSQTLDRTVGSTCTVSSTANALLPGSVSAGARAIWQVDKVQVYDGGRDGLAATGGNWVVMDQGISTP
jgi:hypothetical protein